MGCSNSSSQTNAPPPQKRHWRGSASHSQAVSATKGHKVSTPGLDSQSTLSPDCASKNNSTNEATVPLSNGAKESSDGANDGALGPSTEDSLYEASLPVDECSPKLAPEVEVKSPFTETIIVNAPQPQHREPSSSRASTEETQNLSRPALHGESEGVGSPRRPSAMDWAEVTSPANSPFSAENPLGIRVSRRSRSTSLAAGPLSFSPPVSPSKFPNRNLSFGAGVENGQPSSAWLPGRPSSPQTSSGTTTATFAEFSEPLHNPRPGMSPRRFESETHPNLSRSTGDPPSAGCMAPIPSPNLQRFQHSRELRQALSRLAGLTNRPIPRDGLDERVGEHQPLNFDVLQDFAPPAQGRTTTPSHSPSGSNFLAENSTSRNPILAPWGESSLPQPSTLPKSESLQSEKEVQLSDTSLSPDDRNALEFQ